ncbi:hypothetical protein [Rhizobium sp. S163]|uniref:hypothetical protein n=1 Tax=Rhizobium sp. S163 TaxID=3055039 RepID=UPI0025A9484A|nr:hypothetical protein [Rhizobium sp. S163]MDM9643840.1 hypothetical protein [Rhizobium sp. S163]
MSQTPTDDMVDAARFTLSGICGFEITAQTVRKALESALAVAPAPAELSVGSGDTVMKADVEKMIRDWQAECADHPALHNQGNVLLDRLKALKPSLAMNDFLTGMDCLAEEAEG